MNRNYTRIAALALFLYLAVSPAANAASRKDRDLSIDPDERVVDHQEIKNISVARGRSRSEFHRHQPIEGTGASRKGPPHEIRQSSSPYTEKRRNPGLISTHVAAVVPTSSKLDVHVYG